MFNSKIIAISNLIIDAKNIVDVGCDHCWLSIYLLSHKKIDFAYNIDINLAPLQSGVKNIKDFNFLDKTANLLNDGLKDLKLEKEIDYIIIAGMGSNNIIDILNHNSLESKFFILQTNNNLFELRNYLNTNNYEILNEVYVEQNNVIYPILKIKKNFKNTNCALIANISNVTNIDLYEKYLLNDYLKIKEIIQYKNENDLIFNYYKQLDKYFKQN